MNKKQNMVMWSHLQYIDQIKVMNKIAELIESQTDETMRVGLAAALTELEIWSNTPLEVVNALVHDEPEEDEDDDIEKTWIH